MTEEEWFAAELRPMLEWLGVRRSDRKLRLFAVACCRRVARFCPSPRFHEIIDSVEEIAESQTNEARARLKALRHEMWNDIAWKRTTEGRMAHGVVCAHGWASVAVIPGAASFLVANTGADSEREQSFQRSLLRDIFGNPFRKVRFSPSWRTDTAVTLARQMYDSREFSAMPILADALQDAGCEDEGILAHCRSPNQVHVRGCWVVDLVLGKT